MLTSTPQNYAGDFTLPPPKIVVHTIRQVFPSCRIYRENPRDDAEVAREGRDFTNMVIFCVKSSSGGLLTFRDVRPADFLQSKTRPHFLPPRHEVRDEDYFATTGEEGGKAGGKEKGEREEGEVEVVPILRRNDTKALESYHETSALGHWVVMRTVVPDFVWENW